MTGHWRLVRAWGAVAPDSVRRFARRARRRRLRAAAPWLAILGVLAFLAALGGVLGFTSACGVRQIDVRGESLVTAPEVRTAAAVAAGAPLVRVDTGLVARRVGSLPPVRAVSVTRRWPDTLVITIAERSAVAAVPLADGTAFVMIDETGTPFRTVPQRPEALPLVRLATPSTADAATRAGLTVLQALPPELLESLGTLVAEASTRIRLELTDGRVVVWGDATENAAKARVALVLLGRPGTVLDVSAPTLVTVR